MGKVVMYSSVSVDGFVADEDDQPGPLFDWLSSGDVPLDESGVLKVSQTSYDYTRAYWDQIGVTIVGRHVFDMTDGWDGKPPSGIDHVVVVTHRPSPRAGTPRRRFTSSTASRQPWPRRKNLRVTASSRSPPATSVASPCRGPGRRGADGRRTCRVRVRQALLRVGRRTAPVGGSRRGDSGRPGASPALSGAPRTDLSGDANKSTPSIPIVSITGHGDVPTSVRAMKPGRSSSPPSRSRSIRCWTPFAAPSAKAIVEPSTSKRRCASSGMTTRHRPRENARSWPSSTA